MINCLNCGKSTNNKKFCSKVCYSQAVRNNIVEGNGWKKGHKSWNTGTAKIYAHTCLICGKEFDTGGKFAKYCSQDCSHHAKRGHHPNLICKICLTCGNEFFVKKGYSKRAKYCSLLCRPLVKSNNIVSKSGYRIDLNQFFRSTWEANFARILNYLKIKWEYESKKCRFDLGESIYICDFYLPEINRYIEVKGYLNDGSYLKLKTFHAMYSDIKISILDKSSYKLLTLLFKDKILGWE